MSLYKLFVCIAIGGLVQLVAPAPAAATDTEVRSFAISIDGKAAGQYQMTITRQDDGSVAMTGQADVRVKAAFITAYSYSYRGSETWKDERLQRLESSCNDNGKRFTVSATADANGLRLRANGQERIVRADVWTTTYWRLPAKFVNQPVPLLDADTGREMATKLEFVEKAQLTVAGKQVPCTHYRLRGPVQVDLWYNAQDRMLRQESMEDGHRTVLELTSVRR